MMLRTLLQQEFDRRRARNARYSLRAFARQLATHHSSVSRILRGGYRLTPTRIRALGRRLGLTRAAIDALCLDEHLRLVESLVRQPGFLPDTRWIAARTGLSMDDVNVAVQLLLHSRRLTMSSTSTWTVPTP